MTENKISELAERYELILGSGSPRRVKLLKELTTGFKQLIPDTDETILPNENPHEYALRMSEQKGKSLINRLTDNQLAISCDTIVILESKVLGKPKDTSDAFEILTSLSGKKHEVTTSIAFTSKTGMLVNDIESTTVFFNCVSPKQINDYMATKEPMDKAGAYGIQGMGAFLVDRIDGNLDTVIGLPRQLLSRLAEEILNKGK